MSNLTRDKILARIHPLDDAIVAQIIATGASETEFMQACTFYAKDKKNHTHADVPLGSVGDVISILERTGASLHDSFLGEAGSTLT